VDCSRVCACNSTFTTTLSKQDVDGELFNVPYALAQLLIPQEVHDRE